jgi:nicotinic acid mononucleotide adenylyltransferase
VQFIQAPLLEISSSQLRWRMRQGLPYRYYLRPEVYEIIRRRDIYGLESGNSSSTTQES